MRRISGHRACLLAQVASSLIVWAGSAADAVASGDPSGGQLLRPPIAAGNAQKAARVDPIVSEAAGLEAKGQLKQALAVLQQAVADARTRAETRSERIADFEDRIAPLCVRLDDWAGAKTARAQALSIYGKLYKQNNWRVTGSRRALEEIDRCLGLTHEARQELSHACNLSSRAGDLYRKGDFRSALSVAGQAAAICRRRLGERALATATTLNDLAVMNFSIGDYALAESLYRQVLEIYRNVLGADHPATATSLSNLAMLYQSMADYAKAEPFARQAFLIQKQALGEDHASTMNSLNNLATLYASMGDYAKAEPLFRQALGSRRNILGESHPDTLTSLGNLAELYRMMGDFAKAEPLARQALEIRRKVLGPMHPSTATSLNSLAMLSRSMQDYAKAEPLFRQALEIRKQSLGENHPETAQSLNNLAEIYCSTGEYAKAEPLYLRALEIRRKNLQEDHPDTAVFLSNLAVLYDVSRNYKKAAPLARRALEIYEKVFANTCEAQSERQQLSMGRALRVNLDGYLTIGADAGASAADLYRHVLAWKGAIFTRQLANRALRRRPDLKPRFDELLSVDVRLSTLALRGPGQGGRNVWEQQVAKLSQQKETIEAGLSARSVEFAEERALMNPRSEDLERILPEQTALIDVLEYSHFRPSAEKPGKLDWERRLAAFVVRHDRPIVRIELGPVEPLAEAIANWRSAILEDGGAGQDSGSRGETSEKSPQEILKKAIWSPLQKSLAGARVVLISPDGVLNQIPFAALPGTKPGSYLIEETKMATLPVPRLLLRKASFESAFGRNVPEKPDGQSLLIVGDVDYGGSPGKVEDAQVADMRSAARGTRAGALRFGELDSTRSEMATIRDSFEKDFPDGKVTPLRGKRATESAFRREAPRHRWLHLATHGFFAPQEIASALAPRQEEQDRTFDEFTRTGISGFHPGLLSGVALCGANAPAKEGEDDGILTAVEVAGLDLERTDLVVLSACETGLGAVAGGEGVLGLQRAFQLAGARTTVASLWKIPDRATMQLMQRFYENLWDRRMSKLDALREAQLWMLTQGRQRGLDLDDAATKKPTSGRLPPRYWAAFVLSGDWR